MQQSNVIAAFILAAYFLFITLRGELGVYVGLLVGTPIAATPKPGITPSAANVSTPANNKATKAEALNKGFGILQTFASMFGG